MFTCDEAVTPPTIKPLSVPALTINTHFHYNNLASLETDPFSPCITPPTPSWASPRYFDKLFLITSPSTPSPPISPLSPLYPFPEETSYEPPVFTKPVAVKQAHECPRIGCYKSFKTRYRLKSHSVSHIDERRFHWYSFVCFNMIQSMWKVVLKIP